MAAACLLQAIVISAVHAQGSAWHRFPSTRANAALAANPFDAQGPDGSTASAVVAGVALGALGGVSGYFLGREIHSDVTGAALGAAAEGFALPFGVAAALHRSAPSSRSRVLSLVFAGVGFGIFAASGSDTSLALAAALTPLVQLPIVIAIERSAEDP